MKSSGLKGRVRLTVPDILAFASILLGLLILVTLFISFTRFGFTGVSPLHVITDLVFIYFFYVGYFVLFKKGTLKRSQWVLWALLFVIFSYFSASGLMSITSIL